MKVLVDTCVWSCVLRHKNPDLELTKNIRDLINDGRVAIIGPIRQELLSGITQIEQFNKLKETLSSFEDIFLKTEYFVKAAEFCNLCRNKGIQGASTDFLICAVAHFEKILILTTDKDFVNYQKYLPIQLIEF